MKLVEKPAPEFNRNMSSCAECGTPTDEIRGWYGQAKRKGKKINTFLHLEVCPDCFEKLSRFHGCVYDQFVCENKEKTCRDLGSFTGDCKLVNINVKELFTNARKFERVRIEGPNDEEIKELLKILESEGAD
jgi:hypothetical protein